MEKEILMQLSEIREMVGTLMNESAENGTLTNKSADLAEIGDIHIDKNGRTTLPKIVRKMLGVTEDKEYTIMVNSDEKEIVIKEKEEEE